MHVLQEIAFFDVTKTGELLSRLSEDTQIIKNAATTNLSEALRNVSTAAIGLCFMFATSWKLTRKHLTIEVVICELYLYLEKSRILIMCVLLHLFLVLALAIVPAVSVAVRQFGRFLRELSHKTQAAAATAASIAEVYLCIKNLTLNVKN